MNRSTICRMVKTTLYLPDDLKHQLEEAARRRGVTEAEFSRQALREAVSRVEQWRPPRSGIIRSRRGPGTSDLSRRVDEVLAEGFGED